VSNDKAKLAELMGYNPVWFWVMSGIILAIIFLSVFVFFKVKALIKTKEETQTPLFVGYPGEIDKAFMMVTNNQMSVQEACQRVSVVLRDFIAQKTGVPATMMTLTDLERAEAPQRLLDSIEYAYPIIFNGRIITDYDEFLRFMNSSRAILDGWWE
jgi:hypothetical protein